jgi:uncharacterized RDD family membrane protein YckC
MTDTLPPPARVAGGPASGARPAAALPPAGPDRRLYAFVIDRAVAWTLDAVLVAVAWWQVGSRGQAVLGVALAAIAVLLVTGAFAVLLGLRGTSPGRALMGLRVVRPDGDAPIGVGRALLRSLVLALATLPTFGFGAASLAWTAVMDPGGRRRGWHDKVADSVVVDVRPEPAGPVPDAPEPRPIVNLTAMRLVPVATPERAAAAPLVPSPDQASAPPRDPGAVVRPPAGVRREPGARPTRRPTPTGPPTASSARWRLTLDSGESFVVEGLVLVGRKPEPRGGEEVRHLVPLRSADLSVSKTHAQLQVVDESLVVMDRGSTNGSVLIRQGVSRDLPGGKPATLLDGDRVLVGDRELRVTREA